MIATFTSLKNLIKTKSYHIDHPIFRLHYQVTVCLLLAFSIILTAKVLFGDTIDCKSRGVKRNEFYDNICYARGTYTEYAMDLENMHDLLESHNMPIESLINQTNQIQQQLKSRQAAAAAAASANNPKSPDAVAATTQSPDLDKGLMQKIKDWAVSTIGSGDDPLDYPNEEDVLPAASRYKVFSSYMPNENFLQDILKDTELGTFLQNQFRIVHRLVKNNDLNFTSTVYYLYSGILVPSEESGATVGATYWHRYYQYVPVILFLQAILFYMPHYLWKNWENGMVLSVCKRLHDNRLAPVEYIDSNYHLIDYLRNCFVLNKSLVYKYYFCHLLLIVNLVGQVLALNAILNNQFITYGVDIFIYNFVDKDIYGLRSIDGFDNDLNNPADFVFPKITMCTFKTFSQAGVRPDQNQFLCALPLNILHDKFFLVLWVWFVILFGLTILQLLFDGLYILVPRVRRGLFAYRFAPYMPKDNKHSTSLSQLFLLDLIGTNSDKFAFSALLKRLNKDEEYQRSAGSREESQSLV